MSEWSLRNELFFNKIRHSTQMDIVNCNAVRIVRPKETKNGWIIESVADRTTNKIRESKYQPDS
jgi:hypothetical protein